MPTKNVFDLVCVTVVQRTVSASRLIVVSVCPHGDIGHRLSGLELNGSPFLRNLCIGCGKRVPGKGAPG